MKMFFNLFLLAFFLTSCSSNVEGTKDPVDGAEAINEISESVIALVKNNNAFALDLYSQQKEIPGNLFFSPYSISTALAMTYLGAGGETQHEMGHVLHFSTDEETLVDAFNLLNISLNQGTQLRTANSLWLQTGEQYLPSFQATIAKGFSASLEQEDFVKHPDNARKAINHWVSNFTFGKIHDLLNPGDVDSTTRLMLVNVIHLKAPWLEPFSARDSQLSPFHSNFGITADTVLMKKISEFPYYHGEDFSVVELPYAYVDNKDAKLSLLVFLPDDINGLANFEKALTEENLENWISQLKSTRVEVHLPKFKLNQSLHLKKVLEQMGMKISFSNQADFSNITGQHNYGLSNVIHEAYLNVDEAGTEAAAATAVSIVTTAMRPSKSPVLFKADHPFFFAIIDKASHSLLFVGRFTDIK